MADLVDHPDPTVLAGAPPVPATSFASDNSAGAHPDALAALVAANEGHVVAYGNDPWTNRATEAVRDLLGAPEAEVLFTFGGTGANMVALATLLAPWEAVVCTDIAHINVDECGAPERFCGAKLIDVPSTDGKLVPAQILDQLHEIGDVHRVQPAVVSITQSTEAGTLYSVDELAAVCDTAHAAGLAVHVDGARLANAVAALGSESARWVHEVGIDVLSLGGTKDGMVYGEAVVVLRPELAERAHFVRKQAGQLPSKTRFVAAQMAGLLETGRWAANAAHANAMANRLAERLTAIDGVALRHQPEVNAVFVGLPDRAIERLQAWSFVYRWDAVGTVRCMTAFDTSEADVDAFAAGVAWAVS